jgi:hypothetical protein
MLLSKRHAADCFTKGVRRMAGMLRPVVAHAKVFVLKK